MTQNTLAGSPPSKAVSWRQALTTMVFALSLAAPLALSACDSPLGEIIDDIGHGSGNGSGHGASGGSSGGTPTDPCAATTCLAGSHCVAKQVQCIKAPCTPVAECVPNDVNVTCGGFAGKACPGSGKCVDDPSDSCDPAKGGADCGGICTCVENVLCTKGSTFDGSPSVCACVPQKPVCGPVCAIYCEFGNVLDANGCPTCACNKPAPGATCAPEKCTGPMPKVANTKCPDGKTVAGPACVVDASGAACAWTIISCPK